ncbi:hypothetical protein PHISCL_10951, partial [Aspergillus sclerotialis]
MTTAPDTQTTAREVWNEQVAHYDSESDDDELPARGKVAKRKREEGAAEEGESQQWNHQ